MLLLSQQKPIRRHHGLQKNRTRFSFADIALNKNADRNRSMQFLRKVNNTIDWKLVEKSLMEYYQIGKSKEGERAYSPLLLFKCLLLQNWFQIKFGFVTIHCFVC